VNVNNPKILVRLEPLLKLVQRQMRLLAAMLPNLLQHPTLRVVYAAKQVNAIRETYGFHVDNHGDRARWAHRFAQRINAASILV
jgi:hypothetical protein